MDIITVTSTNDTDPSCRRLTVTRYYALPITEDPKVFIANAIREVEDHLREFFPRGMTYTLPYTTVEITPREVLDMKQAA